jgi:UDP-N-acetylmuramoylalanine--D-glutamate ligase
MLKKGIQPNDWVILELSSFQLIDLHHSPKIGVCLMIAPEHLNWHAEMEEYFAHLKH